MGKSFYAYTLARFDGTVFYVGKGRGKRIDAHEEEARDGCHCPKCRIIHATWEGGHEIVKTIVFKSFNEDEVLQHERALIASIGRESLCNRSDGGEGRSYGSPFEAMYKEYRDSLRNCVRAERRKIHPNHGLLQVYAKRRILLRSWYESNKAAIANTKRQAVDEKRTYDWRWEKHIAPPW